MWKEAALVLLAGCDVAFGLRSVPMSPIDAPPPDIGIDAQSCFGTGPVKVCLLAPPTTPLVIDVAQTLDTTSLCPAYADTAQTFCVRSGTDITITNRLRVTGSKPLVLVATGTITIAGTLGEIDASSKRSAGVKGPGTEGPECSLLVNGTSGGPGGTFAGRGGAGGAGSTAGTPSRAPTALAFGPGCGGGTGGRTTGGTGGAGGRGGGAVYLIASSIDIDGTLNASGAGGGGGVSTGTTTVGGGGGGAGGTIALDAPTIRFGMNARVFANGGGGGEGAAAAAGTGVSGVEPAETMASTRAAGGGGNFTVEGDGGAGAAGAALDGIAGGTGTNAGGGGGGGAGLIWIIGVPTMEAGSIVSPPPTMP